MLVRNGVMSWCFCLFFLLGLCNCNYTQKIYLAQEDFLVAERMTTYITSEDGTYNVSFNKYIPPGRSIVISMADFNFLNLLQPVTGHVKLINYTYMIFQIYADTPADYFTIKWNFMLISSDAVFAFQASYEYLYLLTNATTIQQKFDFIFTALTRKCLGNGFITNNSGLIWMIPFLRGGNYSKLEYLSLNIESILFPWSYDGQYYFNLTFKVLPGGYFWRVPVTILGICYDQIIPHPTQNRIQLFMVNYIGNNRTAEQVLYFPKKYTYAADFVPITLFTYYDLYKAPAYSIVLNQTIDLHYNESHLQLRYLANSNSSAILLLMGTMSCFPGTPTLYEIQDYFNCRCKNLMGYYHINGDPYPCTGVCNVTGYANQPVNNMCVECRLPFCTKCTLYGECLACNQGFLVVNGTCYCPPTINGKTAVLYFYICIPCEYFYGPECTACDTDNCLNCSSSKYSLDNYDFLTYATCVLCSKYDPQCVTCNVFHCLQCGNNYTINATTYLCYCPNPIISITGYCTNCTYLFGPQCVSCSSNQSACSNCSSGYLISPLNGSCYCPRRVANNTCLTCKAIYGPECLVCNALACTNCSNGYFIDNTTGSCFCPTPVVNGVCLSCSYLYGTECIACNTTNCTGCAHQMLLIRNNCSCPVGHFITVLGVCETCIAFYSNCLQCNSLKCTLCMSNWQIIDGNCRCVQPNFVLVRNGTTECHVSPKLLLISAKYLQLGNQISIMLDYNHAKEQISFLSPIEANIAISTDDVLVPLSTYLPEEGIFQFYLKQDHNFTLINVVNPQDVLWEQTPLSNEPDLFPVCYSTLPIPDWIIDLLVIAIHYSYFGLLLLSLGATNGLFETWILASFLIYCDSPFANPTGLVLQRINELTTFLPLKELVLPFFSWQLPAQSLQQILYHRTLPFLKVNFQIILAFIASICLSTYIRRYLASKSHIHKHYALANYLRQSSAYLFANFLSLFPLISFAIFMQLSALQLQQWQIGTQEQLINICIVAVFAVAMIGLSCSSLSILPRTKNSSVAYQRVDPTHLFSIIQHFFSITRLIAFPGIVVLMWQQQYQKMSLIGVNVVYLFLLIANYTRAVIRCDHIFRIAKLILFIVLQLMMELLTTDCHSSEQRVGAFIFLAIGALQLLQCAYKILRILLTARTPPPSAPENKPLKGSHVLSTSQQK